MKKMISIGLFLLAGSSFFCQALNRDELKAKATTYMSYIIDLGQQESMRDGFVELFSESVVKTINVGQVCNDKASLYEQLMTAKVNFGSWVMNLNEYIIDEQTQQVVINYEITLSSENYLVFKILSFDENGNIFQINEALGKIAS